MKRSILTIKLAILLFAGLATGQDSDPFADPPEGKPSSPAANDPFLSQPEASRAAPDRAADVQENVSYLAEFIEVDPISLTQLLSGGEVDLADGDAVRSAAGALMEEEKARLVDWSVHLSRGGRSQAEAITEWIYPVEFDPGNEPSLGSASQASAARHAHSVIPMMVDGVAYWPPASYPHPTTFETRHLGMSVSISDASLVAGSEQVTGKVELRLDRHDGESGYMPVPVSGEEVPATSLPLIGVSRCISHAPWELGKSQWIGTARGEAGNPVMMFLSCHRSQRAAPPAKRKAGNRVSMIGELIEVDASWLERELEAAADGSWDTVGLRAKVQEVIEEGEATLREVVSASGQLGDSMRSDGTRERIYPTEYDPAELPEYSQPENSDLRFWSPASYPTPSNFEPRNAGLTLQATVGDLEQGFEMDVLLGLTDDLGDRVVTELITPRGREPLLTMPTFATLRITTTVSCHPGEVLLLGAVTPRGSDKKAITDKRVLMFLRVVQ